MQTKLSDFPKHIHTLQLFDFMYLFTVHQV
uniref:Uncharacterized protein n=1 Tax=Anguilla anguilla TaxID=7936 RepID=A0A0E9VPG1_ANGAN